MSRSLGARLIVGTTLGTMVVFVLAAFALFILIRRAMLAEFDAALDAKVQALAGLVEQGEKGVRADVETDPKANDLAGEGFSLRDADGMIIAQSRGFLYEPAMDAAASSAQKSFVGFCRLPDGRRLRFSMTRFLPHMEDDEHPLPEGQRRLVTLLAARDMQAVDARLAQLGWLLAAVFGGTAMLAAGVMGLVVRRGLRPLGKLAAGIHGLGHANLAARMELAGAPSELEPVIARLNELLARLEASFARERAFTADVAHELRTPLAGLAAAMEVGRSQRRSAEEYERVLDKCLPVTRAMRGMVENLLTLARADARQLSVAKELVDPEALLRDRWREFSAAAEHRGLRVQWAVTPGLQVATDPKMLGVVLRNLFDNAVSYADENGALRFGCHVNGERLWITIGNTGSLLPAEARESVFDPFWRGDAARSGEGRHCGLGLALCRRIVELLAGTAAVQTAIGGEFVVTIGLPVG